MMWPGKPVNPGGIPPRDPGAEPRIPGEGKEASMVEPDEAATYEPPSVSGHRTCENCGFTSGKNRSECPQCNQPYDPQPPSVSGERDEGDGYRIVMDDKGKPEVVPVDDSQPLDREAEPPPVSGERVTMRRWVGDGMPPGLWDSELAIFDREDGSEFEEATFIREPPLVSGERWTPGDVVGFCPICRDEFYVPHGGKCPAEHDGEAPDLIEYVPKARIDTLNDDLIDARENVKRMIRVSERDQARIDSLTANWKAKFIATADARDEALCQVREAQSRIDTLTAERDELQRDLDTALARIDWYRCHFAELDASSEDTWSCPTCGENPAPTGQRCERCKRSIEEDRLERESNR